MALEVRGRKCAERLKRDRARHFAWGLRLMIEAAMNMAEDVQFGGAGRELCGAHELFFGVLGGNAQLIETVFEIIRQ